MSQNYPELLYSHFSLVGNQSQQGRKIIEEIIDIFEERANIEEKYAKSLEKLVISLAKMEDRQQMFKIPIYCLKSIYASRKHQAEGFHQSLREDLILQLKQLINQQNTSAKKLIEEAKKLEKEHQFLNSETKRNFQDYKQKKREYEQNATIMVVYNLLSEYTEKKRINQYYKVNQVTKEVTDLEQKYKQSISDYNTNCEQARTRMQAILTQMQDQEEKRIIVFKDALMRQIIFEVSHAKNVQYDLDKITEKLDEIVPHEEVNKFAISQKLENPPLFEKTELIQLNSYISNSLQKFFQKEFDEILSLNSDQKVKEIMKAVENGEQVQADDAKQENTLYAATLLSAAWKEEEVAAEIYQELKQKITENYQLRKLIIIGLQQKRASSQFKLGPIAFTNVTKLFNSILEICLETFDAGTARQLLNLSFTFNKDINQGDKVKSYFIQNDFAQHKAWENRDLWETSIIQQIYEQLKEQQAKQKLSTLFDQISAEKNMILTILTQMAQNMMLFNFSIGAIKDIMSKFMAFFELNEEISYDLFNAIEGFEKQKQAKDAQEKQAVQQEQEPQQQNVMGKISQFFSKT